MSERFYVREHSGWTISRSLRPYTEIMLIDSHYCHQVVERAR